MAVVSRLNKISVTAQLNNGTKDGKVKTLSLSLGTLNTNRYNDQKAMNIVNALEPCLSKSVYEVLKVEVSKLTNDD
ncbi:MAG: hypothetical protein IJS40_06665 [Synergistaceae bacterium]|nr:hypothetical protein [Synergistaceae bacterium]